VTSWPRDELTGSRRAHGCAVIIAGNYVTLAAQSTVIKHFTGAAAGRTGPGRFLGRCTHERRPHPAGPGRILGLLGRVILGRAGPASMPDHLVQCFLFDASYIVYINNTYDEIAFLVYCRRQL